MIYLDIKIYLQLTLLVVVVCININYKSVSLITIDIFYLLNGYNSYRRQWDRSLTQFGAISTSEIKLLPLRRERGSELITRKLTGI